MQYYSRLVQEETGTWWKIVEKESGQKMGAIGYNNYSAQHRKCEVGYWLLPQHWGKGIISEALPRILQYLFKEKQVHRIEALVETGNAASCQVAERAGFLLDGTLRDCEWKNNGYISLRLYSLLSSDHVMGNKK